MFLYYYVYLFSKLRLTKELVYIAHMTTFAAETRTGTSIIHNYDLI